MTQDLNKRDKPQYTGFMAGWAVFLAFYQVFLAARHGGLFWEKTTCCNRMSATPT